MKRNILSLRDALAVSEINKHKWLESEKIGCDIGFLTAAVDWISRYGQDWQDRYDKDCLHRKDQLFLERREFRRFSFDGKAILSGQGALCFAKIINLSFMGVLCQSVNSFGVGKKIRVQLPVVEDKFITTATIERACLCPEGKLYELFLRFSEDAWKDLLRIDFLNNI